jgi:hypothetical protein
MSGKCFSVTLNEGNEGKNKFWKKESPVTYVKVKYWYKYGEISGM